MRQVIIELCDIFKSHQSNKLVNWVNAQYHRSVYSEGTVISLRDIKESDVNYVIRDFVSELNLSLSDLLKYAIIVPAVDRQNNRLTAQVELKSNFFKDKLLSAEEVSFLEHNFIFKGMPHQIKGEDYHIEFSAARFDKDADLLLAFVNGTVSEQEGSVGIPIGELNAIQALFIDKKYGGLNPFDDDEWMDIFAACVYRRIDSCELFASFVSQDSAVLKQIRAAIDYHNNVFKQQVSADNLVRNDYGRVIGEKITLFTPAQIARERQRDNVPPPSPKGVQTNVANTTDAKTAQVLPFPEKSQGNAESGENKVMVSNNAGEDFLSKAMQGDFSYLGNIEIGNAPSSNPDDICLDEFSDF